MLRMSLFASRQFSGINVATVPAQRRLPEEARRLGSYVTELLPCAVLCGLASGLLVTPLTAGVLAAVEDADLREASAINDVIGATVGDGLAAALMDGYRQAMFV